MRIAVPKEIALDERRVATVPDVVEKLVKLGFSVAVKRGAGDAANPRRCRIHSRRRSHRVRYRHGVGPAVNSSRSIMRKNAPAAAMAAAGGDGFLELDVTRNPLRLASEPSVSVADGHGFLGNGHGIGVEMSLERVWPFLCDHIKI